MWQNREGSPVDSISIAIELHSRAGIAIAYTGLLHWLRGLMSARML